MDDVTGNVFSLFCSTWRAILKMFVRLIWIQASESREKKISKSYLHYLYYKEKKNGEKETKRALYNLRMPKLQKIFTTVVAIVCHYERLAVLQKCFRHYSALNKKRR